MFLAYKPDLEEAVRHWEAYWEMGVLDRPTIAVRAPRTGVDVPPGPRYTAGYDEDFHEVYERVDRHLQGTFFGGDAMPFYDPSFGPDQMAAFLGSRLVRMPQTTWSMPCVADWDQALPLRLDPENYWWNRMLDFCRAGLEYSQGKFLIGVLDMHSNMDLIAALRDPQQLLLDLVEQPETVDRAMLDARRLYAPVYDAVYEAAGMEGRGTIGWTAFYSPRKFAMMQCDSACMISPEMFRRWVLPALEEEAAFLDHSIYHYDGPGALQHLDMVLGIKELNGVQWVQGAGNGRQTDWLDLLKTIQAAGKCLHVPVNAEEARFLHRHLRPEGAFYEVHCRTEEEARDLLRWFERNT